MNNSSNYEIFSGDKYVITADGKHSGEVYNVEEFFDRSDFTGRNNSFAYYVYPQLFSYVIFSIYDWSNA